MTNKQLPFRRRTVLKTIGGTVMTTSAFTGVTAAVTITIPDDENTLAAAINAADPGDTIVVKPGEYAENVVVDKPITIVGSGDNETILDGGDNTGSGFRIESTDVTIRSLSITRFMNGINIPASEVADNLTVEDVTLDNNAQYGIWGPSSQNDFEHHGVTLTGVTTTNHTGRFYSRGVWFMRGVMNLTVEDSEFSDNSLVGFDLGDSSAAGSGGHSDVTITNSIIEGNGDVGLAFHAASDVEVTWNNIEGNGTGVLTSSDEAVDATENWWGHASGPGGDDGRTNPAGKEVGRGDDIEGDVDFEPWLRRPIDHPSR